MGDVAEPEMLRAVVSLVLGLVALVLAAATLVAGYAWTLFAWSGGEYAEPPPSLGQKLGQALPWALASVAVTGILTTLGVVLLVIARRGMRRPKAVGTGAP
jgi:TRAP-type C4-dicarboxylate transport system permease small subunit